MEKKRIVIVLVFVLIFLLFIIFSFLYNKGKFSVSFETGTSEVFLTKYVKKNDKVSAPSNPVKDGYIFKEWQLNGEKYDFNSEVKSDTILTAKWIKEEYVTISFDTLSSNKIEQIKVLKGDIVDNLPIAIKENYEFIGWFIGDNKYENTEIYDDTILTAKYKNSDIDMTYKIGDKVLIIGKYSNSSNITNKTYIGNKKAIGWERVILDINEENEYPYVVGNKTGITGFFKASSIKVIK